MVVVIIALLIFVVAIVNVISLFVTRQSDAISAEYGLYVLAAGGLLGLAGATSGLSK